MWAPADFRKGSGGSNKNQKKKKNPSHPDNLIREQRRSWQFPCNSCNSR